MILNNLFWVVHRHHRKDISVLQKADKISYVDSWKLGKIMDLGINDEKNNWKDYSKIKIVSKTPYTTI